MPRIFSYFSKILLSSLLLFPAIATADVRVSPMVIETEINRGQAQGTITVSNVSDQDFRGRIFSVPFTYDAEEGFQFLESSANDLTPYLQFSPRELQIPGRDQRRVRFIARVPPSLPDGEYRAMLITENLEAMIEEQTDETGSWVLRTTIVPQIGVAVYVRKGNISHNLEISSVRYNPESNRLQLLVRNSGQASVIVQPEWVISQGNQEIQSGRGLDTTVIAEKERFVNINLSQPLEPGDYQLSGNLGWGVNRNTKIPFSVTFTVPLNRD